MRVHLERCLPYAASDLCEMVADVRAYPEFIPWIVYIRQGPVDNAQPVQSFEAEAGIGISLINERFTTRIQRDLVQNIIAIELIKGPFRRLTSNWKFTQNQSNTLILFDIDFEFKTPLLDAVLRANMGRAIDRLMACFETRAQSLFTPLKPPEV